MNKHGLKTLLSLTALLLAAGCSNPDDDNMTGPGDNVPRQEKKPVESTSFKRRALFGDLHVHSSWSLDSYVNFNAVDPDLAYRFARGEKVTIAGGREVQLALPLDFAAVTDHAEYFGELSLCLDQSSSQYNIPLCRDIRNDDRDRSLVTEVYKNLIIPDVTSVNPRRKKVLCGDNGSLCTERARATWRNIVQVAEEHNRPGECTTLVAYEWTGNPEFKNLHRNIIFRNTHVPELPASHFEANTPLALWQSLEKNCRAPCEAVAIPHNSNQSKGLQFPRDVKRSAAQLRSQLETLVEIVQTKGESECKTGVGNADEFCNFEKLEQLPVCRENDAVLDPNCARICKNEDDKNCIHGNNYARNALKDGLLLGERIGVNPYRFGFIGSTDTHNGTPGASDEKQYNGVFGAEDASPEGRARIPAIKSFKPPRLHGAAGLAGVWAEQNTRDSIFAALKRRETFATSGPRIVLRFFAGWDMPTRDAGDFLEQAYEKGTAMGGELSPAAKNSSPEFLAWAVKAADGAPLQRIQVIKGWLENGEAKERTFDVSCSDGLEVDPQTHTCPDNGAEVDIASCAISRDRGASELFARWSDPGFDPDQPAFYYLRVIENPSCRWSTWEAIREGSSPFHDVTPFIQERAWSSPIWYTPPG